MVNDVKNSYNGLGQLVLQSQSHAGAVGGGTPGVNYAYDGANGGGLYTKGSRPVSFTYPNGRVISLAYSGTDGDKLARVSALQEGGSSHVAYSYLGLGTFVVTDYPQPDVKLDYTAVAAGDAKYPGFDRFNRVVDHRWIGYGASPGDRDRFKYGYDRNSNRLYRENVTAFVQGKPFDELYAYDRNNRLVDFKRGTLAADKKTITGIPARSQAWQLDATGNWPRFTSQTNGTVEVDQSRTHNQVNEITDLSVWFDPRYDAAGNMTRMPQPANPTEGFAATYDAWNRLVKLRNMDECGCPDETVAEYEYDAQNWRTVKRTYAGGSLSETRHFYYSAAWQVLEERVNSSTNPERQFLWGARYIDDLVLRDRDTNADGSLDERLFATQDANWNVTSLVNTSGATQERFAYEAYGTPMFLTATYGLLAASQSGWETLFGSYRRDTETAMYCVRHRYLSPNLGTWLSRDPLEYLGGNNKYGYLNSNPPAGTDPRGLKPQWHHWLPRKYGYKLARRLCQGPLSINIDDFTTPIDNSFRDSPHGFLHNPVVGLDYNAIMEPYFESARDCCDLLIRMLAAMHATWTVLGILQRHGAFAARSSQVFVPGAIPLESWRGHKPRTSVFWAAIVRACYRCTPPKVPLPVPRPVPTTSPTLEEQCPRDCPKPLPPLVLPFPNRGPILPSWPFGPPVSPPIPVTPRPVPVIPSRPGWFMVPSFPLFIMPNFKPFTDPLSSPDGSVMG